MALFEQKSVKIPSFLLKDKYNWPPFSILNTMSWDWQRRKDDWESLFTDSTLGRDVKRYNATPTNIFSAHGKEYKKPESIREFDPYLAELMIRWFSLPGRSILDPFAGGCVRGVVASVLGRNYTGIDLSSTQVETNYAQYTEIMNKYTDIAGVTNWIIGDAEKELLTMGKTDMVFTCPPYYKLEKYSNDPNDLSNLPNYTAFLCKYAQILYFTAEKLRNDGFFVIVVSEVRADSQSIPDSQYVGLVPDTINILRDAGLKYYNEIILENSVGSLPIRAPRYFNRTRKIGRHHQNILVFYKGAIENIEEKFGTLE